MKISYNWLKTLIDTDLSANEVAEKLTACGLEVEGLEEFESIKGSLKGLVVGHVLECEKHPDADKLKITKVDIGSGEPLNIVCGAPNVAAGQKVVVATVGAKLYPSEGESFEIKKSKIRGAVSEGMLCAEDEIGLGKSHAGIIVLPEGTAIGKPVAELYNISSDTVLEIGLTPNRSDAASHVGVARDLAAILNCELKEVKYHAKLNGVQEIPSANGILKTEVKVNVPELCKRYSGVTISGITVKESPEWLKNYLSSIGLRPINNIVDITNFVLHEIGQPLHAFDAFKLKDHTIVVRTADENEPFVTLDGVERKLKAGDLIIADSEKPVCIAGVFGGKDSGVDENTKAIFLESAYFDAAAVRKTSKNHGLKTDASFRFERGTDPNNTIIALNRAVHLILELAGGQVTTDVVDIYPTPLEPYKVAFSYKNCNSLIGKEIDRTIVKNILI